MPPATAQWVRQLPSKVMERVKEKERKIDVYAVFNELNLYIKYFSGDKEEIKESERLVHNYNKYKFNRIYITDYWGDKRIHEITV